MIRRLPLIPTIIVVAAALTMVALGIWQLGRAEEKAALLEAYASAATVSGEAEFPTAGKGQGVWFRRTSVQCDEATEINSIAGTAASGSKGWAFRATCKSAGGGIVPVDLGFSRSLKVPEWDGGQVTGIIAPGPRLVADPPLAGLQPLAKPDPSDLPNNHLAYAGQWFFFALTALAIYGFAVRSRLK